MMLHRASQALGQAIAARCLVHSYQHASDISAGQRGCLSIHSAGSIRDGCATCGYTQVPLEKRNNSEKALLSRESRGKRAGGHVKISRY